MPISKLRPSFTFTEDRLCELQAIVPEAFADSKIHWPTLQEALGEDIEDPEQEHFGLTWPGKREARRFAAMPSKGTLVPQPGQGVNEDVTHNIFIEGDNLEVLKLLQKSYAGRVKMIYIDPPYNTGNDFVYPDDYSEPLEAYLKRTGQMDEAGKALTTNTRGSGRYHSNWLNMMYPRLLLARQLLRDDGILFISIDDNEVQHLRIMCNEIYGEENFVAQLVWQKKTGAGARSKGYITLHEYVLCYAKRIDPDWDVTAPMSDKTKSMYSKKDEYFTTLGPFATWPLDTTSMDERPNLRFPIIHNGIEIWPKKQWLWSRERVEKAQRENKLIFNFDEKNQTWNIRFKGYLYDENGTEREGKPTSLIVGMYTQEGTKDFEKMFDRDLFPFPKPVNFIKNLLSIVVKSREENEIYLDFFAGSGTTAQSIFELNREDSTHRQFILVQIPEVTPSDSAAQKANYQTISDICKERIRRVIKKMKEERIGQMSLDPEEDLGFKVLRLEGSQFKEWRSSLNKDIQELQFRLDQAETSLIAGWETKNLLVEILLIEGFPLNCQMQNQLEYTENQVQEVSSVFCQHKLYICLDATLHSKTVETVHLRPEDIFICLESALDDQSKLVLADRLNLRVI